MRYDDVTPYSDLDEGFARFVIERMPAALSIYDAEGQLIYSNPMARSVLGLDDAEMDSRSSGDLRWRAFYEDGSPFPPDDFPINRSLRTGEQCYEVVMGILRPDETYSWLLINSEPIIREGEMHANGAVA